MDIIKFDKEKREWFFMLEHYNGSKMPIGWRIEERFKITSPYLMARDHMFRVVVHCFKVKSDNTFGEEFATVVVNIPDLWQDNSRDRHKPFDANETLGIYHIIIREANCEMMTRLANGWRNGVMERKHLLGFKMDYGTPELVDLEVELPKATPEGSGPSSGTETPTQQEQPSNPK